MSYILSVSELSQQIKALLETDFSIRWVQGEISNFKQYSSGHCYFSLKDSRAQIRCVIFRSQTQRLDFIPQNGMKVEVLALPSLYTLRGDFQLSIESMRRAGLGELFANLEKLKEKLQNEGLFSVSRKRPLPRFPRSIGIVTSMQAAALQDILTTLQRRCSGIHIVIYPTAVQGVQAGIDIAAAIQKASLRNEVEVLIIGRGGGSIEDLWAFNEEVVARSIAETAMPVISAVGHESDFTIADLVADMRAPTPTAAAELASPEHMFLQQQLSQYRRLFENNMRYYLQDLAQHIDFLSQKLISPVHRLTAQRNQLVHFRWRLPSLLANIVQQHRQNLMNLRAMLNRNTPKPLYLLQPRLEVKRQNLQTAVESFLDTKKHRLGTLSAKLNSLAPQEVLRRGYAMVTDYNGDIIHTPQYLKVGERILLHFAQSKIYVQVSAIDLQKAD